MPQRNNVRKNKYYSSNKLFISWSKPTSQKIAECLYSFIKNVSSDFNAFISTNNLENGSKLISGIEDNLKKCYIAIFVITADNIKSEWLHYELGFLTGFKSKAKTIPLLFNVDNEELTELFKEKKYVHFNREKLKSVLIEIHTSLTSKNKESIDTIKNRFDSFYEEFENSINSYLNQKKNNDDINIFEKQNINLIKSNKKYGFYGTIPEEHFHSLRREILSEVTETLTIVGSSLYEAFSSSTQTPDLKKIDDIISDKISNKNSTLKFLRIFISEPKIFDEPFNYKSKVDKNERPPKRIKDTLDNLIVTLNTNLNDYLTIEIFFIPLFQLDHIVLTDKYILSRSTMLWVSQKASEDKLIKGPFYAGFKSESDYSLYNSYKRYLDKLTSNCTEIDLSEKYDTTVAEKVNSKATEIHLTFRNDLIELNKKNIKLYKLYESQLKSSLRSTWLKKFRNIFKEEGYSNEAELFLANNFSSDEYKSSTLIKNNKTQKILLPYIHKTEQLLNQVVKKYDKDGFAHIIPSFDLGVPNNIQRISGGFATGSVIVWNCGTPIVPIDATVNICSSSVYQFSNDISAKLNRTYFDGLLLKANKEGFVYNFESSNHFIIFGKDNINNTFFLVLHSSAKEYKYGAAGLYPNSNSWYLNKVKTVYNTEKDRYLRYIKDDDAIQFYKLAKNLDSHNIDVHNWFAEQIAADNDSLILSKKTHHHYGMPTCYSINIGTFLLQEDDIVPLFSNRGKNIAMIRPNKNNIKILINGKNQYVIPHGWGQDFKNDIDLLKLETRNGKKLMLDNNFIDIKEKVSIADFVKIREFDNQNHFQKSLESKYSSYTIVSEITPIVWVDKDGFGKNE